jgi:hypothetical protein
MKTLADRIEENVRRAMPGLRLRLVEWQEDGGAELEALDNELLDTLVGEVVEMLDAPRFSALEVVALLNTATMLCPHDEPIAEIHAGLEQVVEAAVRVAWADVEKDIGEEARS